MTTLTPLPAAPQRTDDPDTFATKADAFVAALDTFRTELSQVLTEVNAALATNGVPGTLDALELLRANAAGDALEFAPYKDVAAHSQTTAALNTYAGSSGQYNGSLALSDTYSAWNIGLECLSTDTVAVGTIIPLYAFEQDPTTNWITAFPSMTNNKLDSLLVSIGGTPRFANNGAWVTIDRSKWAFVVHGVEVSDPA